MEDKSVKRRNWIKNIAIIFLTLMLILTLFSQTFMNMSLPEVSGQNSRSGSITTQIPGTGTVKARDTYSVIAENSTKIKDVGVKVGSEVKIGDTLYVLEDDGSDQLIEAMTKLAEYKTKYNDTLALISPDFSAKVLEISYAREDLANARTELSKLNTKKAEIVGQDTALSAANTEKKATEKAYNDIKKEVDKLTSKITATESKISVLVNSGIEYNEKDSPLTLLEKAKADLVSAEKNITTAEENKARADKNVDTAELNLEKANDILSDKTDAETNAKDELSAYQTASGETGASEDSIRAKERALEELQMNYKYLLEDYNSALSDYEMTLSELQAALDSAVQAENLAFYEMFNSSYEASKVEAYNAAKEATLKAQNAYNKAAEKLPSKKSIEAQQISIKNAEEDLALEKQKYKEIASESATLKRYKDAVSAATEAKKNANKDVTSATKALEEAKSAQTKAGEALTEVKGKLPTAKSTVELYEHASTLGSLNAELTVLEADLDQAEIKKDAAAEKYNDLSSNNSSTTSVEAEIKAAQDNITSKERALEKLENELAEEKNKASKDSTVQSDTLKVLEETIKTQEEKVAELSDSERTSKVTAPVAGKIITMKHVAGEEIKLGDMIAEIQIVEKGYMVEFPVTVEQAAKIKVGDSATVQYYWGSAITAVIDSIQPDTSNPQKSRIVTLAITGDVTVGTSLSFTIGQRSQNYECIVPKSAIRTDSSDKYVLVVDSKTTPLGNRYTARKVPVTVVAEDDSNAAVTGLSYNEYIITTASTPIESGMQVRLIES